MKAKPTKAQVEARVNEILRIRLDGAELWDIREYVREKEQEDGSPWKLADGAKPLSDSQLYRYLAKAEKLVVQSCHASRKKLFRRHLAQRRNLYAKAVLAGDIRTALAVLKDLGELLALYPGKDASSPQAATSRPDLSAYLKDPVGYAENVLGVTVTPDQADILRALTVPPFKVEVPSAHDVGKTWVAAVACNWWYDTRDPGIVLTTAPTQRDVVDLLWAEVRIQRQRAGLPEDFIGPSAPMMRSSQEHYAKGFTAKKGETFKGRHRPRMLFIFDEANEIDPPYFTTTATMFDPEQEHAWLCIYNPTDTTTAAYQLDQQARRDGSWHRFQLSALNHPNIKAQLDGKPAPIPGAVSLSMVNDWVRDWCDPIKAEEHHSDDLEWPPGSGHWHRPGPIFQCRAMGLWPSAGTFGIWSERLWEAASQACPEVPAGGPVEIGCDVARYGDDWTVIVVRVGPVAVHHEAHNGWNTAQTAARLKELCRELAPKYGTLPERIPVKIDDDGVGGGVVDQQQGYRFLPVNASSRPHRPADYPNKRSELWFTTAELARKGLLCLGQLNKDTLARMQQQALAPTWKLDSAGRRVVEPKEETKQKLRRSPDDLDALNLCFYQAPESYIGLIDVPPRPPHERRGHGFGRGR